MKKLGLLTIAACLLTANFGGTGPVRPRPPELIEVPAFSEKSVVEEIAGGVRAHILVSGNARTYLGIYVFDVHGNCVARDDLGNRQTFDDLNAEWYPPVTAPYGVAILNYGPFESRAELAFP